MADKLEPFLEFNFEEFEISANLNHLISDDSDMAQLRSSSSVHPLAQTVNYSPRPGEYWVIMVRPPRTSEDGGNC